MRDMEIARPTGIKVILFKEVVFLQIVHARWDSRFPYREKNFFIINIYDYPKYPDLLYKNPFVFFSQFFKCEIVMPLNEMAAWNNYARYGNRAFPRD